MKNYQYVHVLMAAGAALCLFAAPSMAMDKDQGPGPGGPMGMSEGGERGPGHEKGDWKNEEKTLGLTEDQRAKMKVVREAAKTQQETLRTEMKASMKRFVRNLTRKNLTVPRLKRSRRRSVLWKSRRA